MGPPGSATGSSRNGFVLPDWRSAPALCVAALSVLLAGAGGARADNVSDFYRGKTVRMVIGTGEGGGYEDRKSTRLNSSHR